MKTSDRRSRMERLLALREAEGLTYVEAARRGRVAPGTLAWWNWRLRKEKDKGRPARAGGFVEGDVVDDDQGDTGLELVVGVYRVRIGRGFDAATLERLMRTLSC